MFEKYAKEGERELKLKRPGQMKEVLDMTRELILEKEASGNMENMEKLKVLKSVLEMWVPLWNYKSMKYELYYAVWLCASAKYKFIPYEAYLYAAGLSWMNPYCQMFVSCFVSLCTIIIDIRLRNIST